MRYRTLPDTWYPGAIQNPGLNHPSFRFLGNAFSLALSPCRLTAQFAETDQTAAAISLPDKIDSSEGVAVLTMGFSCIDTGWSMFCSQGIGSRRNSFQMSRVDTQPILTKVINCHSGRYGAHQYLVGKAMGIDVSAVQPHHSVSRGRCTRPMPTTSGFANLRPESFFGGSHV